MSPNGAHGGWAEHSRARRSHREEVALDARSAVNRARWVTPERARVSLRLLTKRARVNDDRYRPLDEPNAVSACKGLYDALVDAGAIKDDAWRFMRLGGIEIDPTDGPGLEVTVEVLGCP
jgi:Holliday junction resolvase RusA-like endonuclease